MEVLKQQAVELKRLWKNKRQLAHQALNLAMVVLTALMIWKGLMAFTQSESPVVVVLSGSMEPAFQRGDILYLDNTVRGLWSVTCANSKFCIDGLTLVMTMQKPNLDIGDIVVYKIKGRDIPIVHRVLELHRRCVLTV